MNIFITNSALVSKLVISEENLLLINHSCDFFTIHHCCYTLLYYIYQTGTSEMTKNIVFLCFWTGHQWHHHISAWVPSASTHIMFFLGLSPNMTVGQGTSSTLGYLYTVYVSHLVISGDNLRFFHILRLAPHFKPSSHPSWGCLTPAHCKTYVCCIWDKVWAQKLWIFWSSAVFPKFGDNQYWYL